jgi:NitT/TauT family transport system permease protein
MTELKVFFKRRYLEVALFYLFLILIWVGIYFIAIESLGIWKSYAFPSPWGVLDVFYRLLVNHVMGTALLTTTQRMLLGYGLTVFLGMSIGILTARWRYLSRNLCPLLLGVQTLPSICWVPFAILWFGLSNSAVIFIVVVSSFCSMALSTVAAITNINPLFVKASRTLGAKGYSLYRWVILPAAVPALITGLKQAWSFAWRGLMAGEMLIGSNGIGQVLMRGRELADINQVMAMIIVVIGLGVLVEKFIFGRLEKHVAKRWGLA